MKYYSACTIASAAPHHLALSATTTDSLYVRSHLMYLPTRSYHLDDRFNDPNNVAIRLGQLEQQITLSNSAIQSQIAALNRSDSPPWVSSAKLLDCCLLLLYIVGFL